MSKQKITPVLRARVGTEFLKAIDEYIDAVNEKKPVNPLDRSYVVREAVLEFLARNTKATR